uniref:Vesicle transport protein USE1 n=1 Tax=Trichuris muris TaxID=70415 RepID=A0A5S6QEQ7_TRIMR
MLSDSSPLVYEPDSAARISRFLRKVKLMIGTYQDSVQFRVDVAELAAEFETMETESKWSTNEDLNEYNQQILYFCNLAEEESKLMFVSDMSSGMSEEDKETDEEYITPAYCTYSQTVEAQTDESQLEHLVVYAGDCSARLRRLLLGDVKEKGGPEDDDPVDLEQQQIEEEEEMLGKFSKLLRQLRRNAMAAGSILREDNKVVDDMKQQSAVHSSRLTQVTRATVQANKWICDGWVWTSVIVVLLTFIAMAPFIRLFPKY